MEKNHCVKEKWFFRSLSENCNMMPTSKACSHWSRIAVCWLIAAVFIAGCAAGKPAKPEAEAPAPDTEMVRITRMEVVEQPDALQLVFYGNQALTYTSVKQVVPPAVLLYFPDTELAPDAETPSGVSFIDSIDTSVLTEKGSTVRVEVRLDADRPYDVMREGNRLVVQFAGAPEVAAKPASDVSEESVEAPMKPEVVVPATVLQSVDAHPRADGVDIAVTADGTIDDFKSFTIQDPARIVFDLYGIRSPFDKEQVVPVGTSWVKRIRHYGYADRVRLVVDTEASHLDDFSVDSVPSGLAIHVGADTSAKVALTAQPTPAKNADGSAWVNRIDFSADPGGKSTVIVGTTQPVQYEIKKATETRLQLELSGTQLPDYHRRPLVTTRFESAVDRVTPIQNPRKDMAVITIELRESVPYFVEQTDNLILVHFDPSTVPPKPLAEAQLPDWQQVMEETIADTGSMGMPAGSEGMMPSETPMDTGMETGMQPGAAGVFMGEEKQYTGEKIALDFYETDIKNVFRILREISGKNFAIDKDVTGEVTLSLDKPVPWDQVLDLVLKMNGLGMTMEGDIVRIATRSKLDAEKALDDERKARAKEAKQQQKALEPLVTEYLPVNYANAQTDVLPHIVTTPERGSVTVDARNNQIIVTDTADMVQMARETVARIDRVTPQVMIEARVVEATKNWSRTIGTRWGLNAGTEESPAFLKEGVAGLIPEGAGWLDMKAINAPTDLVAGPGGTIGINFSKLTGTPFEIVNARLVADESEGRINIISAPKVLTLDNKQATIKQGVSYPLTRLDADGNTVVEFQDVALELIVTPHITPDNRISMEVKISNNEIGAVINGETSFTTKEAVTELLVNDGDTVVIGGIRKTREDVGEAGIPVLKDIPLVSWLFKQQSSSDDLEELIIFITPKIVMLEQRG